MKIAEKQIYELVADGSRWQIMKKEQHGSWHWWLIRNEADHSQQGYVYDTWLQKDYKHVGVAE